jgi:hypothetical protein
VTWQRYRGWIIGLIIMVGLLGLIIVNNVEWQECFNPEPEN